MTDIDNSQINFDTPPPSRIRSDQFDTPPPSRFGSDQTLDLGPFSDLGAVVPGIETSAVPGTATSDSKFSQRLAAKLESNTPDGAEHRSKWRHVAAPVTAGALALGIGGVAALMARTGKAEGRPDRPAATKTVDNPSTPTTVESPLERAYESTKVIQQSKPFEFSGLGLFDSSEVEKDNARQAIERNHAEFVTGVQLSSGLKLNFYQAHIVETDANDKLEVDGRAVEMLANQIMEMADQLPDTNPYSRLMKKLSAKAQQGKLDNSTVTIIISTQGECLDDTRQEIINDDMGIKGLCKVGKSSGVESNVEGVISHNPTILLSQYKTGYRKNVSTLDSPRDIQQEDKDPRAIVLEDAEAAGFAHELTHAFVAIIGRQNPNANAEHMLLVNPIEEQVIKLLVKTPGERQQAPNKYISPFHITRARAD